MAGVIRIAILANAANAIKGIKDTEKAAGGLSSKVGGLGSSLLGLGAGAVGIATVGAAFKSGVDEASKFQDAANQTAAAIAAVGAGSSLSVAAIQKQSAALETLTGAKIDENAATLAQNKFIRAGITNQAALTNAL